MTTEAMTDSAQAESPSAAPSNDLNIPYDPDFDGESQETDASGADEGPDPERETDESADNPAQEAEDEPAQVAEEPDTKAAPVKVSVPDDALVTLQDGTEVRFADLKEAPMLKAHFTRSMQELGNQRRAMTDQASRLQNVSEAFVNFLAEQIPPEPGIDLAVSNAPEYVRQKAIYDAAVGRIQALIEVGTKAKTEAQSLSDADLQAARVEAATKVTERLPFLRDPVKAREFDKTVAEAASFIGYTPQDVAKMTDPRQFLLAHYAAKGIKAEQAEKKVQAKVQAAPQATPAKTAQAKGNPQFLQNKEAMRSLKKSGSIRDAMRIDFE